MNAIGNQLEIHKMAEKSGGIFDVKYTLLVLKFASYSFSLSFKLTGFNFVHLAKTYSCSFKLAQVIFCVHSFWFNI